VPADISGKPILCTFQEPVFSAVDKEFLQSLGHTVVESPDAYQLVDSSTLLFGNHLYRSIYEEALSRCLPRMFVGTGGDSIWDGPDWKPEDFPHMRKMQRTFWNVPFPDDGTHATFYSTHFYWDLGSKATTTIEQSLL
jgi:hypothetical protein